MDDNFELDCKDLAFFDVDCLEITEVFWGFDVVGPRLWDYIVLGF